MGVKKRSYSPRARRHTCVVDWDNLQGRSQEKSPKKQPAEPRLSTGLSLHQCSWACPTKNILLHPVVTEHKQNLLKIILSSKIISPRRHESSNFLNRFFFFYTNQSFVHTKPVNPLFETTSFWNRYPDWFKAPSTRIRIKNGGFKNVRTRVDGA